MRSVLVRSRVPGIDYSLNPYIGCAHGCRYCYVAGMPHIRARGEPWGEFVEAKLNAPEVLKREIEGSSPGRVGLGVSTDPYQPVEHSLRLTQRILEAFIRSGRGGFELQVLTKSALVLRDVDLLGELGAEVGLTVTTDSEEIRRIFEPRAPAIPLRVRALRELKKSGLRTFAFVGPMLPMDHEKLVAMLSGNVDRVVLDRMNYAERVRDLYRAYGLEYALEEEFFADLTQELVELFAHEGIPVEASLRWRARSQRDWATS